MDYIFTLVQVKDTLREHICRAAQAGLNNANNNLVEIGKFEEKFQTGFVQTFKDQQATFPSHLGAVVVEEYNRESDFEARTGADVCITWTHPQNDHKKRARIFVLYLQIKLLYNNYDHYLNTINLKKPKNEWPEKNTQMSKHFKDLTHGFFDAQYKSRRQGLYFDKYQLLQMQSQMGDFKDDKKVARVTASYLVLDSPKGSGSGNIAKNVFLVPVQSFARVIGDSFYARLEQAIPTTAGDYAVDDVGSLTASQLNDVLETGTIILTPRPYDDFICKWLGNFIKPDLY